MKTYTIDPILGFAHTKSIKKYILVLIFIFNIVCALCFAEVSPKWISVADTSANQVNSWITFRKDIFVNEKPQKAITQIAVDSKYWLWINGELVVFEGGLKRGPNPRDTYYDELDLAPYLKSGENKIAILVWYFGKDGFSHNSSGKAGLFFNMKSAKLDVFSDKSWYARIHPAYGNTSEPAPNWRLPESNIRFDANKDIPDWQTANYSEEYDFQPATELGIKGDLPWNSLHKRGIPLWKDFGIKEVERIVCQEDTARMIYTSLLPYNMQMTPILNVYDSVGNNMIDIETDHSFAGGAVNLRAQYITRKGWNEYESLGWLNGQKIIIKAPKEVYVKSVKYRETGYDCEPSGSFASNSDFYNQFWQKALRTLYVNMRDTYFDCPDRERAQWWGDVVVLMSESFYTFSPSANALMKKAILELANWQREDSVLFSPVPAGNRDKEIPAQTLTSIGLYGFWNYYMNTGDAETIKAVYPAVKRYLSIWNLDEAGLTEYRPGDWDWGDWGENIDIRLILAGWHYIALDGAVQMAELSGHKEDIPNYKKQMEQIKIAYNKYWNGYAYRHPSYHKETDDRVQALAVISGIADIDKYEKIYSLLQTQFHASPYMEKYVMEALCKMDKEVYALVRNEKRFAQMVNDENYTTLFEGWGVGKDGFGGGTTNHAWSGGALTVISQYICGIEPLEAGYKTFKIEPEPTLVLDSVSISVPTILGHIRTEFHCSEDKFTLKVSVPENSKAIVYLPKKYTNIMINNKPSEANLKQVPENYKRQDKNAFLLVTGDYLLVAN